MLKNIFKFLSFTTLMLTGERSSAFGSRASEEGSGSGLEIDEIAGEVTGYEPAAVAASRGLLATNSPTSSPTLPSYVVNNGLASGANSFPAALAYVDGLAGTQDVTFGLGAYNQTCRLTSSMAITSAISLNLAQMSPKGFAIDGGDSYYITAGSTSTSLNFGSSTGSGEFSFINSGFMSASSSIDITSAVREGATLILSEGSYFALTGSPSSGDIITTVSTGATLTLLEGSYFAITGSKATGDIITIVNTGATLALSDGSYFATASSTTKSSMTTTVNAEAALTLSSGSYCSSARSTGTATINSGGLLFMDTAAEFEGTTVTIAAGATFASGAGGAFFGDSSLTFSSNATHLVTIGAGSQPVQLVTWSGGTSTATLGGATLNIRSDQNLYSLLGYNYTIMTAASGSSISGQYGLLQFNGSSINLPYKVYYTPSPTLIKNITVGFPIPPSTLAPSKQPSASPSKEPSASPSKLPSKAPSYEPSSIPSKEPSTEPSKIPTKVPSSTPSKLPTNTPSIEPSSTTPSKEPSNSPSKIPSNQPSGEPTAKPSVQPSKEPSSSPSTLPTSKPTIEPSTTAPTNKPSKEPSNSPSAFPSKVPSAAPSSVPSLMTTTEPSKLPSLEPSTAPSFVPSKTPSVQPTNKPSLLPTHEPSKVPTNTPSKVPSFAPSLLPMQEPSKQPSFAPSTAPSGTPTLQPSLQPSLLPTQKSSVAPSKEPSAAPSKSPSLQPSQEPSTEPSHLPTSPSKLRLKCDMITTNDMLSATNCNTTGKQLNIYPNSTEAGSNFTGFSTEVCGATFNCTSRAQVNASSLVPPAARVTVQLTQVTDHYNCKIISRTNCKIMKSALDRLPANITVNDLNDSYVIMKGNITLHCSIVYECTVLHNCTKSPLGDYGTRRLMGSREEGERESAAALDKTKAPLDRDESAKALDESAKGESAKQESTMKESGERKKSVEETVEVMEAEAMGDLASAQKISLETTLETQGPDFKETALANDHPVFDAGLEEERKHHTLNTNPHIETTNLSISHPLELLGVNTQEAQEVV